MLVRALATEGFAECADGNLEDGIEKVAIYAKEPDGEPTHAALQLNTGMWASKMGSWEDIHHPAVQDLEDDQYGRVVRYVRRTRPESQPTD